MGWTEERIKQLETLWAEGYSASQIARALGAGISRSAVIGKARRLNLTRNRPGIPKPRRTGAMRALDRRIRPQINMTAADPAAPDPRAPEFLGPVNLFPESNDACRFPKGEPGKDFQCCGNPITSLGSSYCDYHNRRAFTRAVAAT